MVQEGADPADLPEDVAALITSLEGQGWNVKVVVPDVKARYWCPGPCRHHIWIRYQPKSSDYIRKTRDHLRWTTCWEEEITL